MLSSFGDCFELQGTVPPDQFIMHHWNAAVPGPLRSSSVLEANWTQPPPRPARQQKQYSENRVENPESSSQPERLAVYGVERLLLTARLYIKARAAGEDRLLQ